VPMIGWIVLLTSLTLILGSLFMLRDTSNTVGVSRRKTGKSAQTPSRAGNSRQTKQTGRLKTLGLIQLSTQPLINLSLIHGATLTSMLAAVAKQNQRGKAANPKLLRRAWVLLGIQFGKPHLTLPAFRRQCKLRRHRLTRAAPAGPKIHQHRQVATRDVSGKRLFSKLGYVVWPQRLFARTARCHPLTRDWQEPDLLVAMWANDVPVFIHHGITSLKILFRILLKTLLKSCTVR